ncbi:MAG: hypothetical protein ACK448_05265 [Bacteroidota bacterium]|jgi:hypothetical protein
MVEIKKLIIKASVNEQNANQENNSEIEEIQKIYEHIEEVKQEILHDVDERIVELIEKRFRK